MKGNYKSLVLVDNSLSIGNGNREIIKETLSYLFEQAGEEENFSLAAFGENVQTLVSYDEDKKILVDAVNNLTYANQDTYITDTLMTVLQEWQHSDFACRSIILITDGKGEESMLYPEEELYFLLDKAEYPVYVIGCVEGKNQSEMKNLAAIARISGGKMLYTEFENSESSVEQKLGDALLTAMQKNHEELEAKALAMQETEEIEETVVSTEESVSENELFLDKAEEQENIIYEMETVSNSFIGRESSYVIVLFGVLFGLLLLLAAVGIFVRKNRMRKQREKEFMAGLRSEIKQHSALLTGEMEDSCGVTQSLFKEPVLAAGETGGTRLLFQQDGMHDVVLEDRSNPAKFFRTACRDRLVIGRSANVCDLVIDYDNSISGKHCEIFLREERWFVRDLKSSNGTMVNGQKVYQELEIHSGDILKLGLLEFRVGL